MIRLVHVMTLPQTAASFLQGQLSWLRQRGFAITVITSPGEQLDAFARQEHVQAAAVSMQRAISPLDDLRAVRQLTGQLRRLRPHIVHAHTPKAGLIAMMAATAARVPIRLYHLHGLRYETSRGMRRALLLQADRLTCSLADRVLCVSRSLQRTAHRDRLMSNGKSAVLAGGSINGLDLRQFPAQELRQEHREAVRRRLGIPSQARCLGFVGRLVRDKGIVELHQAWSVLRQQFPDLHLLLVGPFERGDAVPGQVQEELRSDPRVHLTGLDWQVRPYYAAMDVFTLPTHREGLGNVLLEAAAMELPVVSCRVTGCVDAVQDGTTGQLVRAGDPGALAQAITSYLGDPTRARSHGLAGRAFVAQTFQPEVIWRETEDVYHRLLQTVFARRKLLLPLCGLDYPK